MAYATHETTPCRAIMTGWRHDSAVRLSAQHPGEVAHTPCLLGEEVYLTRHQ